MWAVAAAIIVINSFFLAGGGNMRVRLATECNSFIFIIILLSYIHINTRQYISID
jgi:hypothetical protein